jgi:inhibitor of KinA
MILRPDLFALNEHSLLLQWPDRIEPEIHRAVLAARQDLLKHYPERIRETVPGYSSLAIYLKSPHRSADLIHDLKQFNYSPDIPAESHRIISIPVCYEGDFAPDLHALADRHRLSPAEVIQRHTAPLYLTYFIGFLPGFPYLGGLDPSLQTPRLETPRPRVEAGSVGIAGHQTGVYPVTSPGGWNIIGRSPLQLFALDEEARSRPALLRPGDRVRFEAITLRKYNEIKQSHPITPSHHPKIHSTPKIQNNPQIQNTPKIQNNPQIPQRAHVSLSSIRKPYPDGFHSGI